MEILEALKQPWPWYVSGLLIAATMFALLYFGQTFGFSSNLKTICAAAGGGKHVKFFDFDWKTQTWNLMFLIGATIGGFIAGHFLSNGEPVLISQETIHELSLLGFAAPSGAQPLELFSLDAIFTIKGFLILAGGGFLVGFGSRWAGGCTSGHAISGLSNLQTPSLIAAIGFFVGGLIMTHFIMPLIF
ncbi:MAG: YeeE/YedE family protein [Bacteroidota bacterium]